MNRGNKAASGCLSLAVVVFFLPLAIGVWLPDAISLQRNILAEATSDQGEIIRVKQYWNSVDFYNTELEHVSTNGTVETWVLDGDDMKSWSVPLSVDWGAKEAKVTLGGNRRMTVDWAEGAIWRNPRP
jgi:hypothetical protein